MKTKDFLLSVVCPIHEVNEIILDYLSALSKQISERYEQYEIILVQDGSIEENESEELASYVRRSEGSRLIRLIQKANVDICVTAGMDSAIGDVVVVCLPPFDPPEKIDDFVSLARQGFITVGQRPPGLHEFPPVRLCKLIFYQIANRVLGLRLPANTTYFAGLPRMAVSHIQRTKDKFRFLKVITAQTGLPIRLISYVPIEKDGRVYRSFWQSVALSISVITSQSLAPLRFASITSIILSLVSVSYIFYVFAVRIFKDLVLTGWSSSSVFLAFGFAIIGFVVAVLCEYIAKMIDELRPRPIFSVADEVVSNSAVANTKVANVLGSSEDETKG